VAKLFRKDIARRDAVPRLGAEFIFRVSRGGDIAEIHFCHVTDFVVIIKDHPAVARHAEVFKQHIAGENIGGGKLADGIAILLHRVAQLLAFHLLEPEIERHHAPFDVEMADGNPIAKIGDFARRLLQQQRH